MEGVEGIKLLEEKINRIRFHEFGHYSTHLAYALIGERINLTCHYILVMFFSPTKVG